MGNRGKRKKNENRGILWVLSGLLIIIAVLITAIVVVKFNSQPEEITAESETESQNSELEAEISAANNNVEEIINIYQKHIDAAVDSNKKVTLLNARIFTIQALDTEKVYGNQVIKDSIIIDDILQTASSAAQVVNNASFYGDSETNMQYLETMTERSGGNYNMEGQG